ncbi:MAG: peptidylprolyl isomerase [Clostridiales bacterium]|nr:peptidylprolyl isomerase [Clostridiales bacterium]
MRRYKITAAALALGLMVFLGGCTSQKAEEEKKTEQESTAENTAGNDGEKQEDLLSGKHHVEIQVKDYGTIKAELDADTAPITVTNFVNLAEEGFYDGLTFHRIVSGFMIQGGDPLGNGTGGSEETIKGEFSNNGVENDLAHTRGVLSMARSQDPDSASSQFFIMHQDAPHLDGEYAAFGQVTEGIEIVDKICEEIQPVDMRSGLVAAEEQPVIESIKVVD